MGDAGAGEDGFAVGWGWGRRGGELEEKAGSDFPCPPPAFSSLHPSPFAHGSSPLERKTRRYEELVETLSNPLPSHLPPSPPLPPPFPLPCSSFPLHLSSVTLCKVRLLSNRLPAPLVRFLPSPFPPSLLLSWPPTNRRLSSDRPPTPTPNSTPSPSNPSPIPRAPHPLPCPSR